MPKIPVPKLRKGRVKAVNPTLSMIREEVNETPEELRKRYSPYIIDRPGEGEQEVYKNQIDLIIGHNMHSLSFVITNTPYTCLGSKYSHIKDFYRYQDVKYNDSLVCITHNQINKPESEPIAFCMDIPSFLHIFSNTKELGQKITDHAKDLSNQWNERNSSAKTRGKRKADDRIIFLDYRHNSKCAGVSEIVLCGTTFNFTLDYQDEDREVTCNPEDVVFQLRYQTPKEQSSDGKARPRTKQIILPPETWNELFKDKKFNELYNEVWNKYPLPQIYSQRLEEYTILNNPEEVDIE